MNRKSLIRRLKVVSQEIESHQDQYLDATRRLDRWEEEAKQTPEVQLWLDLAAAQANYHHHCLVVLVREIADLQLLTANWMEFIPTDKGRDTTST